MLRGVEVALQAEAWIGTPVRQGSVRGIGADCKGLVAGVARELGYPEAESVEAMCLDYGERGYSQRLKAGLINLFDPVKTRMPGDILLVIVNGRPMHLAIAAPQIKRPLRTIEALTCGLLEVRPFRRETREIDSMWRWRE